MTAVKAKPTKVGPRSQTSSGHLHRVVAALKQVP